MTAQNTTKMTNNDHKKGQRLKYLTKASVKDMTHTHTHTANTVPNS
jgi:hypothetical protein